MAFDIKTTSTVYTPAWNGNRDNGEQPIKVELKRMTLGDFWKLNVTLEALQKSVESKDYATKAADIAKQSVDLKPIFESYTANLYNLTIEGKPTSMSQIVDQPGMLGLVFEVVTELLRLNTLDEQLKKSSGTP